MNSDSGKARGIRHIQSGRSPVRNALYMAAVVASRSHPELSGFYKHLKGKPGHVALCAVARKLIILLNTKLKPFLA